MTSIGDDYITATNTSNTLTIAVQFTGISGVSFEPGHFNLSPMEQKIITVHFNPAEFENLPEGVNAINTVVDVSAVSMLEQPTTQTIPAEPIFIAPPIFVDTPVLVAEPAIPVTVQPVAPVTTGDELVMARKLNKNVLV
jgi:hypothetical protein